MVPLLYWSTNFLSEISIRVTSNHSNVHSTFTRVPNWTKSTMEKFEVMWSEILEAMIVDQNFNGMRTPSCYCLFDLDVALLSVSIGWPWTLSPDIRSTVFWTHFWRYAVFSNDKSIFSPWKQQFVVIKLLDVTVSNPNSDLLLNMKKRLAEHTDNYLVMTMIKPKVTKNYSFKFSMSHLSIDD